MPADQPCDSDVTVPSMRVRGGRRHFSPHCQGLYDALNPHAERVWHHAARWNRRLDAADDPSQLTVTARRRQFDAVAAEYGVPVDHVGPVEAYADRRWVLRHHCSDCWLPAIGALRTRWLGRPRRYRDRGPQLVVLPRLLLADHLTEEKTLLAHMLEPYGPPLPVGTPAQPDGASLWRLPGPYAAWLSDVLHRWPNAAATAYHRYVAPVPDGWDHDLHGPTVAALADPDDGGGLASLADAAAAAVALTG